MSQHYSMPESERSEYTLPDLEVFYVSAEEFLTAHKDTWMYERMEESGIYITAHSREAAAKTWAGYYWWVCLPGCLPDSDAYGPFDTEQDAIDNATEN